MPFIHTQTNVRVSEEKEAAIKEKLGKAISLFPGKSEYWLMLRFTDSARMCFRGYRNVPMAMVEVELFGSAEATVCERMTATICDVLLGELNIPAEHIYVNYTFSEVWGWNGKNF